MSDSQSTLSSCLSCRGPCIQIFLEAVLTAEELATVSGLLDNLEENGLTLRPKEPPFTVTSNNDDAASCYQTYFRNGES